MAEQSLIETIYWGSTIIGGTLFLLRTIMLLSGGVFNPAGMDMIDIDGDGIPDDIDPSMDGDHVEADTSFKLLSMQGITAFFMMFGLVGLTLLRANLHVLITLFGGTIAGLFTVWVLGIIFSQMRRLQSDGTISIDNTIGQKGTVYLTIPATSSGQVQVAVQGSLKIFDAISKGKNKLATGTPIQVVDVADGKTLIVEKVQ